MLVHYMLWPSVWCVYVLFIGLNILSYFLAQKLLLIHSTLHFNKIWVSLKILRVLPSGMLYQIQDSEKFCYSTSAIASVVNLIQPRTVASLSHCTTWWSRHRITWLCLQQLKLVIISHCISDWIRYSIKPCARTIYQSSYHLTCTHFLPVNSCQIHCVSKKTSPLLLLR